VQPPPLNKARAASSRQFGGRLHLKAGHELQARASCGTELRLITVSYLK
jgi:hypothetical protein